jgi:heme-degrading monooxygenase HmoA
MDLRSSGDNRTRTRDRRRHFRSRWICALNFCPRRLSLRQEFPLPSQMPHYPPLQNAYGRQQRTSWSETSSLRSFEQYLASLSRETGKKHTRGRHTNQDGSVDEQLMIMRICCDVVVEDHLETYLDELFKTVIPLYSAASGVLSVSILQRRLVAYAEVATISAWQSAEFMSSFVKNDLRSYATTQYAVICREPIVYELVSRIVLTDERGKPLC